MNPLNDFQIINEESLVLYGDQIVEKEGLMVDHESGKWEGTGYDWASIALYIISEKFPEDKEKYEFDSESSMFCVRGKFEYLEKLGTELSKAFNSDELLNKYLDLAEPKY